jgi:ferritin
MPSTHRERLEMDLSLALDTAAWCRRNRLEKVAKWFMECVERIRERLEVIRDG